MNKDKKCKLFFFFLFCFVVSIPAMLSFSLLLQPDPVCSQSGQNKGTVH